MAVTLNIKSIADRLVQQNKVGFVLSGLSGTSSTLTQATVGSSQLRGPTTGRAIPINSPILITAGTATTGTSTATGTTSLTDGLAAWIANTFVGETITAGSSTAVVVSNTTTVITVAAWTGGTPAAIGAYSISFTPGEDTYVSDWVPSTGVITVSPVIQQGATDAVLITEKDIKHGDWLMEAISRAVTDRIARWQQTPLTYLNGGDMSGTVSDYWFVTGGSVSYVTPSFFLEGDDTYAFGNMQRVLNTTLTTSADYAYSLPILISRGDPSLWCFDTAVRTLSGDVANFVVYDGTNNANIALSYTEGPPTVPSTGFIRIAGTFSIPDGCQDIRIHLAAGASGIYSMAPVSIFPINAVSFPFPKRVESEQFIGNFHYTQPRSGGIRGMQTMGFSEPITTDGGTHHINNYGDHLVATFNFAPGRPVYFDELVSDPDLTSWTSTTTFPLDQVCKWARFELFDTLMWADPERAAPDKPKWRTKRNAALQVAQGSVFEPEMIQVVGRV